MSLNSDATKNQCLKTENQISPNDLGKNSQFTDFCFLKLCNYPTF